LNGQTQAQVEVAIAQKAVQIASFDQGAMLDSEARNARLEAAARAVRASSAVPTFGYDAGPAVEFQVQKFAEKAEAEKGFAAGEQQKYYGKGSEAVLGQFAAPDQPQKYADKAAATQPGTTREDGSGEAKYFDKVSQTDADLTGDEQPGQQKSMYDRAQEVAAGLGEKPASDDARKTFAPQIAYSAGIPVAVTEGQPANVQVTA
jgi:hypothetical protein